MVCEETRAVRLQSIGLEQGRKREGEPKLFLKMRRLSWGEKMKCTHLDWRQPRVKTARASEPDRLGFTCFFLRSCAARGKPGDLLEIQD